MKGISYLEWNPSLFWKGSQMSKYIALNSSVRQILEHRRSTMCSQSVFQLCLDVTLTCHITAASMAMGFQLLQSKTRGSVYTKSHTVQVL